MGCDSSIESYNDNTSTVIIKKDKNSIEVYPSI